MEADPKEGRVIEAGAEDGNAKVRERPHVARRVADKHHLRRRLIHVLVRDVVDGRARRNLLNLGPTEELGKISGSAWGLGYVGGIACTAIVLAAVGE